MSAEIPPPATPQPDADSFRLLFHHHPLPMWIYHLETLAFLDVNDAAVQKYGYSRDEFLAMTIRDIRPAEDVARLLDDVARERPSLQQSTNWRHCLKDGSIVDVEITSHTLEYRGQQAALVMVHDVTHRNQAEEALATERHWLRTLIDNLPDLIFLKDADSRFIVANQATATYMGVKSPDELLGKTDADFYPPDQARQFWAEERRIIETGEPVMHEVRGHRDLQGREYWMSAIKVPLRDDQGQFIGLVGVERDITPIRRAQNRLRQSEARLAEEQAFLRTLINTIPDLVWLKDLHGVYLSCNPAFQRFFNLPAEKIIGKTDHELFEPRLADFFQQHDRLSLEEGNLHIYEEWVPYGELGARALLETIKIPMHTAGGDVIGVLGIARDITNVRRAELDLREREAKLNTLLRMLPVGISILGPNGEIEYANPALTRILDMSPLGLARGDYHNRRYLQADGSPISREQLPSVCVFTENKPVENVEVGIETEDGKAIWTSVSAVPAPFDDWKVLVVTADITARKQAEMALNRRLLLETLMSAISASLAIVPDTKQQFDEVLNQALAQLGVFLGVDRISLVLYCAANNTLSNTHQWCAEGVPAVLDITQNVPVENMAWLEGVLASGHVTPVYRVANLPANEQTLGQMFDIKSVLLVPLLRQNEVIGLLSLEAIRQEQTWPEAEFNILAAIGQIFATALDRHQNTAALQESESRFRQIAENIRDAFYLTDRVNWRTLYISPAYEQIMGRSRDSLYANPRDFITAVLPDDRPLVEEALVRQSQGEVTETEYRITRPDGATRWLRNRAFPVRNAEGQVVRVSGLVADITVYKTLFNDLERSNRRLKGLRAIDQAILQADDLAEPPAVAALRHLYGLIPCTEVVIFTFDAGQNEATILAHMVEGQFQPDHHGHKSPLDSVHHDRLKSGQAQHVQLTADNLYREVDRHRFERGLRSALLLPLVSHGELLGKLTLLSAQPDFFTDETVEVASEVAGQIALAMHQSRLNAQIQRHTIELEQRVAERTAEIFRVSQRLELAIQAGDIGIWDWEIKPDRLVWDEQMFRLYGFADYVPKDPSVKMWQRSLDPEDAPRAWEELEAALRGEPFDTEFRIIWPDGSRRHIKAGARVIFDAAGQPERMIGVNIDVTERKQAEQKLRRSRDQLSAANAELARLARLKDEFLANMSHELRTPLNAILGLTEILLEGVYGPLNENQVKSMRVLEESGRHLLALINDILDVSKMEVGKLSLEIGQVNVEVLCQSSLRLVRESAQKNRISINTSFDPAVTFISGDERRLKQMLVNLLSNAAKFTPAGGSIGLEVKGLPAQEAVHISVWDTGIGIAADDAEQLFKPFIQIDSSLSRKHTGTGLGLVLVQRIAELHGGSVSLTSKVNQGSRFTVSLPWVAAAPPPPTADVYQDVSASQPLTIGRAMLVEDHPVDATRLADLLAQWDIETKLLSQGEEVVDRAAALQPDVVLLDLQLPGLSGWAVLAQLKASPHTHHIPVVITSVLDEAAQGLALGAAAYLVKPISPEQLRAALHRAAERSAGKLVGNYAARLKHAPLILLAEDNENNILAIRGFLEAQGFRLLVARNGMEAIKLATEEHPDLILMDIQMPDLDGMEATRKIRSNNDLSHVPIIAVTALAMPGDRDRCLAAGANDYLTKPVSLKRLRDVIVTQLAGSQP